MVVMLDIRGQLIDLFWLYHTIAICVGRILVLLAASFTVRMRMCKLWWFLFALAVTDVVHCIPLGISDAHARSISLHMRHQLRRQAVGGYTLLLSSDVFKYTRILITYLYKNTI